MNFIYQLDRYGLYPAKSLSAFLEARNVKVLPWPAKSQDLNPIEHVWPEMKRTLRKLDTYPSTADTLLLKANRNMKHVTCRMLQEFNTIYVKQM